MKKEGLMFPQTAEEIYHIIMEERASERRDILND
jgi:hypothetical protein